MKELSDKIIGSAIEVHEVLGSGLIGKYFNVKLLQDGIKRIVNEYPEEGSALSACSAVDSAKGRANKSCSSMPVTLPLHSHDYTRRWLKRRA